MRKLFLYTVLFTFSLTGYGQKDSVPLKSLHNNAIDISLNSTMPISSIERKLGFGGQL